MAPSSTYAEILQGRRGRPEPRVHPQFQPNFSDLPRVLSPSNPKTEEQSSSEFATVVEDEQGGFNRDTAQPSTSVRKESATTIAITEPTTHDTSPSTDADTEADEMNFPPTPMLTPVLMLPPTGPLLAPPDIPNDHDHDHDGQAPASAMVPTPDSVIFSLPLARPEFTLNGSIYSIVAHTEEARLFARGEFSELWFDPQGYDVVIKCDGFRWHTHRHVLIGMSEWMERFLPPANKTGEPVVMTLNNWHPGILGGIIQFMYLENYKGGDFDPQDPYNTSPIVHAIAHFNAGAAVLCRDMMDCVLTQLDAATENIKLLGQQGAYIHPLANMDLFESMLRRGLLMLYDEPDQWRIRSLRVVMGKLMAVAFPWVLQNPAWGYRYASSWGILHARVVTDHKWLVWVGQCEPSPLILTGFEHMAILWVKYRGDDWKPSDDLIFPNRVMPCDFFPNEDGSFSDKSRRVSSPELESELESQPEPVSVATCVFDVIIPAGGKKNSRAIPIKRPDGTLATIPALTRKIAGASTIKPKQAAEAGDNLTGVAEPSGSNGEKVRNVETSKSVKLETSSFNNSATGGLSPIRDIDEEALFEAASSVATTVGTAEMAKLHLGGPSSITSPQAQLSPKINTINQPTEPETTISQPLCLFPGGSIFPGPGLLPGGPHYFKETSTGEPLKDFSHQLILASEADLEKRPCPKLSDRLANLSLKAGKSVNQVAFDHEQADKRKE
ncbi:hypothetical protein BD289DRAFT_483690 [Coniella lustricola]|uniref:BTB domain-containing protein n=1 Tax=Coniella lustricola TaxID=2025994 RepID=A0A2T3A4D6_9PEZI|nr:hypothetical protein BD289DRAFT_483690 [Coniella lustricola]